MGMPVVIGRRRALRDAIACGDARAASELARAIVHAHHEQVQKNSQRQNAAVKSVRAWRSQVSHGTSYREEDEPGGALLSATYPVEVAASVRAAFARQWTDRVCGSWHTSWAGRGQTRRFFRAS